MVSAAMVAELVVSKSSLRHGMSPGGPSPPNGFAPPEGAPKVNITEDSFEKLTALRPIVAATGASPARRTLAEAVCVRGLLHRVPAVFVCVCAFVCVRACLCVCTCLCVYVRGFVSQVYSRPQACVHNHDCTRARVWLCS